MQSVETRCRFPASRGSEFSQWLFRDCGNGCMKGCLHLYHALCNSVNGSKLWMMAKCGKLFFLALSRCLQGRGRRTELRKVKPEQDILFKSPSCKGVLTTARVPPVSLLDMAKVCSPTG